MKKIVYCLFFTVCVIGLSGCAQSEKPKIALPASPNYPTQSSSIEAESRYGGKSVKQPPRYLQIEDNSKVVMADDIETALPSMIYVNDRIFEYGRKLDLWKELDSQLVKLDLDQEEAVQMVQCFHDLQKVLNGYMELRGEMLQAQKISAAEKINSSTVFELQKSDITFLESSCGHQLGGSKKQSSGWSQREEGADLAQLEILIDRYAENEEYEEILQVWAQIPEFQIERIHLRTKIIYGNALVYLHQEKKAAEIYRQVVEQMSVSKTQATDIVSLRKVLADLYTATGDYEEAEIQYKKISVDYLGFGRLEEWSKLQLSLLDNWTEGGPELVEYTTLLRNFLRFNVEKDGYTVAWEAEKFLSKYPYSPVSSNVDYIKERVVEDADHWFSQFMEDVGKLGAEKKFKDAVELLEMMPLDILGNEKQIQVNEKNQELILAIAVEKETEKMAQIQELQRQWNDGMLLVKNEEYEEALTVFRDLLDTEYAAKAEQKIGEISLQAAKSDRRKAADLFIRFTKTTDLESKKKLLVESRKLLKNILVKYPDVEVAPKVKGNIERVEQEMNGLDPNLIFMADQETVEADEDNLDAAFAVPSGMKTDLKPESVIEEQVDSVKLQP